MRSPLVLLALLAPLLSSAPAWAQLSPDEELKALQAADGVEVSLFASEPLITNPAAIDVDTRGRVWVAEIQWYRGRAKEPGADKLKVLEDTDGDGRADKVTVFAEGLFAPMSVCVAGDKVYVATSPDLWVYEDKDGDLKADGPPTKLLTGFGGHNHDHGAHSIVLGPDHKWWMAHGDTGFDVTGKDGSHIKFRYGAMLRGELDGTKLEKVAENFRNPYEMCVSSFGEPFCSDNDDDGNESVRICWIMEGGNYGWFGRPPFPRQQLDLKVPPGTPFREGWHFRAFQPGYVPGTVVTGFGSPCGICYYEGDAFSQFKNSPLHADAGPREVRQYPHKPNGFGFRGTSKVVLGSEQDAYFRPDDVCVAPDGSLLVSDWYDGGVGGHGYNDPDRGRIFLLKPKGKKLARADKPGPYADVPSAIAGLKSPNLATQYLARVKLLESGQAGAEAVAKLLSDSEPNLRARALWLLDRMGGDARKHVTAELENSDPTWRALAVRILRRHGGEYADAILARAGDASPEVRREVLLAIPKIPGPQALTALVKLAQAYEGSDRYELEALYIAAKGREAEVFAALTAGDVGLDHYALLALLDAPAAFARLQRDRAQHPNDEAVAEVVLTMSAHLKTKEMNQALAEIATSGTVAGKLRRQAADRLIAGLQGNDSSAAADPEFVARMRQLFADPALQPTLLDGLAASGLTALGPDVLAVAANSAADLEIRRQALRVYAQLLGTGAAEGLRGLASDSAPEISELATDSLIELQDPTTLRQFLTDDGRTAPERRRWIRRLMGTGGGPWLAFRLLEQKQLPDDVRERVIAAAAEHPDAAVRALYEQFIPEDKRPVRLGAAIKPEEILALKGDDRRGAEIFEKSSAAQCKSCHAVQNFGGRIGPELTTIGKKYERAALLETILEPSKAIAPEYVPYLVETTDGRVLLGFLAEKTDQHVVLKDAKGDTVRLAAGDVESMQPQRTSLMPELVLRDITAQDAADLLAFLMTLK
ncbi:MAG: PVC-type heme-binding CxxCH protein [Pirellulales bacterium]